jgi:putative endopeptidase
MYRQSWSRVRAVLVALIVAIITLLPLGPVLAEQDLHSHGIDPANMDLRVDPSVDFYRYANGGWLDRTAIPSTLPDVGGLPDLAMQTHYQLLFLLFERAKRADAPPGSDEWKAIRLFEQGIDLTTRNAQGVEPVRPILDEIAAIDDLAALHRFLEGSVFLSVPGLFYIWGGADMVNSTETVAYVSGPVLRLARDSYLNDDASTKAIRETYTATSAELLTLAGADPAAAQHAATAVTAFESDLARLTLSHEEAQDLSQSYHPTTIDELSHQYPSLDWPSYLERLGLDEVSSLVVTEARYMAALDAIVRETPLPVIKNFLKLQLLWPASSSLSEAFDSTAFRFRGTTMNGVTQQGSIQDRTFWQVNHHLGDALGKLYVAKFFSPQAKAQSTELVETIIAAYRLRLERNPWLSPQTKAKALEKLDALHIKVGYPDEWDTYEDVAIGDSYFASALSASNATYRDNLAQIGKAVDKSEWSVSPQTVSAYYNPPNNEIIIPAGILQPPFFDPAADPAANFGAIGFVIGHEITHAFDLQGSQFDAQGNLVNWWTDADRPRFETLNDRVEAQYSGIEVLDGIVVDGELTVTENVADLGGIQVAYDALQHHLAAHGRPLPPPPGSAAAEDPYLTQEQRFFIAAATVWRTEIRDEALRTQVATDEHAPATVRGTQPLRNCDAFYEAFAIEPGDPMYLPPQERIVIW